MPFWPPWLLVAVAVAGVVLSIATDPTVCTPKDPSVCGPDLAFAWAIVLLGIGLLTLWVWPVTASVLVLGYVALDLVYDPARPAHVAFAMLGLLVLGYAAWHFALRRHQQAILADLAGPAHPPVVVERRSWPRPVGVLVAAAFATLVCGSSGLWYAHQVDEVARHVAGSVVVDSVAGTVDSDGNQAFRLSDPPAGAPKVARILTAIEDYPEGSHQPVRVDRDDPEWVRLVAEPDDHTGWLSLSLGAGILAALMVSYAIRRELSRRRLSAPGAPGVGVSVRVIGDQVWVSAADGSHTTLATFGTSEGQDGLEARRGVLIGDLRAKGWAAVWTDDAILLPLSRLSVEGGRQPMTDAAAESLQRSYEEDKEDEDYEDLGVVGEEVVTGRRADPTRFPITAGPAPWLRLVGALLVVGAVVGGPIAAWSATEGLLDLLPILLVGGTVLERGVKWSANGLLVTMEGARLDTGFSSRELPFAAVHRVRVDQERVILLSDEDAISFEPCPDLEPRTVRLERVREVAEMVRGLVVSSRGGATTSTRRVRPGAVAVVLFVLGVALAGAARHLI